MKILRWRIAKGSLCMNSPYHLIKLKVSTKSNLGCGSFGYRMYNFQDSSTSPSSSSFPAYTSVSFPFILLPLFLFTCSIRFFSKSNLDKFY